MRSATAIAAISIVAAATIGAPGAARARRVAVDERVFRDQVRPALARLGCASGVCHASGQLPLRLEAMADPARAKLDLAEVRRTITPGDAAHSLLMTRPLGRDHLGGRNLDERSCEAQLIAAWIDGRRHPGCPARPAPPPTHPLDAALVPLVGRCATAGCHLDAAAPRLLPPSHPGAAAVAGVAFAPHLDRRRPSTSRLLRALAGERHAAIVAGPDDPDYRRLFAWMTGEAIPLAPPVGDFGARVQPTLVRRGCTSNACHGGGAGGLILLDCPDCAVDNALRLLARTASGDFPAKPLGEAPHGGGTRLGRRGDCAFAGIDAWLTRRAPPSCAERPPPDRARFASLVQPSLEALTCPRCHLEPLGGFQLLAHPDTAQLEANYKMVVAHIDRDFPPASPVLLRVRETCMQSRLLAWVDGAPDPGCTVRLANFKGSFPSLARARHP